ncbi:PP2C family protein-serine/threonine phosphatase [Tengunoibacter tsumagoiensis]|uniref:Protein phosphatase n=1 Tax=Tengunoibacter tsumagoiensis TaxID=2014871 RepID=A0A402A7S8_9CHLR|nr:protein phosphatase 2C domain-containing protein [Tengunoibacter tsumagoiensis]GCE15065.1 protein phosphatase [Tengunoibacter tsumagoiensis]
MPIDITLFLQNIQAALINRQYHYAQFLVDYTINVVQDDARLETQFSPFDVSIGLHPGRVRQENEDCILAVQGMRTTQEEFGLFVVCDGMGGHDRGQEAAHLAVQTILETVLPVIGKTNLPLSERILVDGIQAANRAIYVRNQGVHQEQVAAGSSPTLSRLHHMGTTVTAVLLFRNIAYIANVGDSRTYLYNQSLKKITKDHSLVAQLLADGYLQEEEEMYTHPSRHQISRALGVKPSVEVDTFMVPLLGDEILLLCSDGLWEMTRDQKIEAILASSWANASLMSNRLVQIAHEGGGKDNIGCIVVQLQRRADISSEETVLFGPVVALKK